MKLRRESIVTVLAVLVIAAAIPCAIVDTPSRAMHPVIYEINTWVWLCELSLKYGRIVDLGTGSEV
jgi:hypothetical protein